MCVCLCVYPSGRIHVAACGPIGTKFGTRMEIHLEMVMGEIKITQCDFGGIWGGFRGSENNKSGITTKRMDQLAPNLAHMYGFIWVWT